MQKIICLIILELLLFLTFDWEFFFIQYLFLFPLFLDFNIFLNKIQKKLGRKQVSKKFWFAPQRDVCPTLRTSDLGTVDTGKYWRTFLHIIFRKFRFLKQILSFMNCSRIARYLWNTVLKFNCKTNLFRIFKQHFSLKKI